MEDMQLLKELLKDNALLPLQQNYDKYKITLREPRCPNSVVEITGLPYDSLVLKIDHFPDSSNLFKGNNGECKRADYAIIVNKNGKKLVLFIEIKKRKDKKKSIIEQFKGAICIFKYCQEIGREFWNTPGFLKDFEYRFICFAHTYNRKRRTRITKETSKKHDTPENMMKIDWPANIRFTDFWQKLCNF